MNRPEGAPVASPAPIADTSRRFRLPVRVYYQDTDAGGVVFHAAYLSFFERARTEFLRSIGFDIGRLAAEGVLFALHRLEMEFLRPARLDDALEVTAAVGQLGRTSARFVQTVERADGTIATQATLSLVCVSVARFRPMGIPEPLRAALESGTLPPGDSGAPRAGSGAATNDGAKSTG